MGNESRTFGTTSELSEGSTMKFQNYSYIIILAVVFFVGSTWSQERSQYRDGATKTAQTKSYFNRERPSLTYVLKDSTQISFLNTGIYVKLPQENDPTFYQYEVSDGFFGIIVAMGHSNGREFNNNDECLFIKLRNYGGAIISGNQNTNYFKLCKSYIDVYTDSSFTILYLPLTHDRKTHPFEIEDENFDQVIWEIVVKSIKFGSQNFGNKINYQFSYTKLH